jgi:hypothetical protein
VFDLNSSSQVNFVRPYIFPFPSARQELLIGVGMHVKNY